MKKILYILPMALVLGGCFGGGADLDQAKNELLNGSSETAEIGSVETNTIENIKQEVLGTTDTQVAEISKGYEIEYLGENKFIRLDELEGQDFYDGKVELSGTTLTSVDKITVEFSNSSSDYPDDNYTLKSFKSGDATFKYKAYDSYKTLDFGNNVYLITAYSGEKISKLKLTITLDEAGQEAANENAVRYEKRLIGTEENSSVLSLPSGGKFGEIVLLGEDAFTYENINNLEIKKVAGDFSTSCENITDYLTTTLENNWFYWNTCRDVIYKAGEENQTAISFYVVTLEDESYNYIKHYLDFKNGLYGTYKIKSGEWVETDDKNTALADLNSELKAQNSDFTTITTVDNLFKEIVR